MRSSVLKLSFFLLFLTSLYSFAAVLQETTGRERSFEIGEPACTWKGKSLEIKIGDLKDKQGGYLDITLNDLQSELAKSKEQTITFRVERKQPGKVKYSTYSGDDQRKYETPDFLSTTKASECSFSVTRKATEMEKANPTSLTLAVSCVNLKLSNLKPETPIDQKFLDTKTFEIKAREKGDGHIFCATISNAT